MKCLLAWIRTTQGDKKTSSGVAPNSEPQPKEVFYPSRRVIKGNAARSRSTPHQSLYNIDDGLAVHESPKRKGIFFDAEFKKSGRLQSTALC